MAAFGNVSSFLALVVIGYGFVQALAPRFMVNAGDANASKVQQARHATLWGGLLAFSPALIAYLLWEFPVTESIFIGPILMIGLGVFGVLFAINSSLHSYLIVASARADGVSLDVGFYYMANAAGRLLGTVLSGWVYQVGGLIPCLLVSSGLLVTATLLVAALPSALASEA